MVLVDREQRNIIRKFIDLAYTKQYFDDEDIWDIQIDFAPEKGYWGKNQSKTLDTRFDYQCFNLYRIGIEVGAYAGISTIVSSDDVASECELTEKTRGDVNDVLNLIPYSINAYLKFLGLEKMMTFTRGSRVLRIGGTMEPFDRDNVDAKKLFPIFQERLAQENQDRKAFTSKLSKQIILHLTNTVDADSRIAAALADLSMKAFAYWTCEKERYERTHTNDGAASTEEINRFLDICYGSDELLNRNDAGIVQNTVSSAIQAFTDAYKYGKPPFIRHSFPGIH